MLEKAQNFIVFVHLIKTSTVDEFDETMET